MKDSFYDLEAFKGDVPLGRFGAPHEIVAPTLFMLSDGGGYVTGAILHVDGGLRLRPWFGGLEPTGSAEAGSDVQAR